MLHVLGYLISEACSTTMQSTSPAAIKSGSLLTSLWNMYRRTLILSSCYLIIVLL